MNVTTAATREQTKIQTVNTAIITTSTADAEASRVTNTTAHAITLPHHRHQRCFILSV
jgi:hypothetical protein